MAQLLDQLHVDVREEPEPKVENNAQEVPVEPAAPAVEPHLFERPEEQQENAATNGACSIPAAEPTDLPGPSVGSQEGFQPPDITRTVGLSQPDGAAVVAGGEQEQRPADILDQVPYTDRSADSDSGPTKPPRQFTAEPDIVASTKKPPPSRPPPPIGGPPPRPPPPSWQTLPSKKSQECLRPIGLEGRETSSQLISLKLINVTLIHKVCEFNLRHHWISNFLKDIAVKYSL